VGDNSYTVGANTNSIFNTRLYAASLRLSILRTRWATAGLSLGARWLEMDASVSAQVDGFRFSEGEDMTLPMLLPGLHGSVNILPRLMLRGSYEHFGINLANVRGDVIEVNASAEFYVLKYLGIGAGYTYLNYDASKLPSNDFLRSFSYRMEGMTLFVAGRF
jgi:hypothetical protein